MRHILTIAAFVVLGACAAPLTPAPATGVAPMPRVYTCAQMARAAAEMKAAPADSMLAVLVNDYGVERRALRAYHRLPLDGDCAP